MHRRTPRWQVATLFGIVALALWGCSGSDSGGNGHRSGRVGAAKQQGMGPSPPAHHARQHHHRARHPIKPKPAPSPSYVAVCPPPSRTLAGVYHPDRLQVRDPCRRITGRVSTVRSEEDGDVHLGIDLDRPYRGMLMQNNASEQGGNLVVEFMPRDHGHLTEPSVGNRVLVIGAYVDDTEHGWSEIHPVFGFSRNGGPLQRSGPQEGGSPASKPSPHPSGGNCDPNYSGACLDPNASDYDCAGGGGDGPKFVGRVRVVGTDHFGLDSDGDGIGCE